jgi:hypothetical protein
MIKEALVEAGYDLLNGDLDSDEENDWEDETQNTLAAHAKRKKSKRMRLRTRVVNGLWEKASAEEVAAVLEEVEEEKKKMQEEEQEKEEETHEQGCAKSTKSPAELQELVPCSPCKHSELTSYCQGNRLA